MQKEMKNEFLLKSWLIAAGDEEKWGFFSFRTAIREKERMGDEVKWAGERLRAKIADDAKKIHLALSREIFNPWMKYNLIYIFIHGSNLKKETWVYLSSRAALLQWHFKSFRELTAI